VLLLNFFKTFVINPKRKLQWLKVKIFEYTEFNQEINDFTRGCFYILKDCEKILVYCLRFLDGFCYALCMFYFWVLMNYRQFLMYIAPAID